MRPNGWIYDTEFGLWFFGFAALGTLVAWLLFERLLREPKDDQDLTDKK